MILSTHALVGAAIGAKIHNPWLIIPIVIVIHFFLDGLRHGEYFDSRIATVKNTWWKITLDLSLGLFIIFGFIYFGNHNTANIINILIGSFFSMFPDLLTVIFYCNPNIKILAKIKNFHSLAHRYDKNPKYSKERQWNFRNSLNDLLISIISIIILII